VHPGPRLHPGDPRSGAGRAAGRDPGELRLLAQRESVRLGAHTDHRAAGLAVRQPGALDRNAGPAVHRGGRGRPRCGAVPRALSAKMRIDQIEELDSIESITDGASSRRNQLLVDLGSELNLGAIDGAAEADLAGLRAQVTKLARTYKPYGPVLSDVINDQLRTVLGPSGKRPAYIAERVKKTWELRSEERRV